MIAPYIVFQSIALFGLLMWWHWWSGRRTTWLEGRTRGWICFLFRTAFTFFQGVALALVAIGPDTDDPGDSSSHQEQVLLRVTPTAHRRVGAKGWNAGPLQQAHSEENGDFQVALQPATKAPPGQIARLVTSMISR